MSLDHATAHLAQFGLDGRIRLFDVSSATVELAAQAVGCPPAHIAKTLSFLLPEGPVLILAAGDARVDNAKYKARFHTKAKMIPSEQVEPLIGHGVGGVCPFGVNEGVPVYLDQSLRRFDTVYPAAGTANSAVELSLEELERAAQAAGWVDVCKDWG
ncbi:MAG TPA: YbaK/EbsC family protein [Candidatus Enterenecus merdae]|nr:YbaK/EbsC family protein [Candidatus Enterenecus merdae]